MSRPTELEKLYSQWLVDPALRRRLERSIPNRTKISYVKASRNSDRPKDCE
jgi:hypothetical protein